VSQTAVLALLTAVVGTIGYHLAQRQIAPDASPALVLVVAYLVGAAICGVLLVTLFPSRAAIRAQLSWPVLALGVAVVLIEVGFVWMYRSGWMLTTGALVVNVLATLALAVIGTLAFGERLHWTTVAGAAICLVGLGIMRAH
jgi:drug/metabolite transporter (DMT)-like permease